MTNPGIPKAEWVRRFAERLRFKMFNAGGRSATEIGERTYADASDLEPEEAADIVASTGIAPEDPGSPD